MPRMKRLLIVLAAAAVAAAALATPALATEVEEPEYIEEQAWNVPYGPGPTEYGMVLPASQANAPVLLFVHGGWAVQQSPNVVKGEPEMLKLQENSGFMIYAIDFPQTCRARFPVECGRTEAEAVVSAYHWLQLNAPQYGGDPTNIEILGASAGGTIAERAAFQLERQEPGVLRSVTELSAPWLNNVTFVPGLEKGETASTGDGPTASYLDCPKIIGGCSEQIEIRESPIFHLPAGQQCPPEQVSWGEVNDIVAKSQSIEFARALEANGCPVVRNPAPRGHAQIGTIEKKLLTFWQAH
jgi:acetyl esterase/lipase